MAVTPDTTIHLLKVPIEIDELNQLTFATATAQYNYFIALTKKTEEDLFYQRKDNYIAWPDHIDNIIEYNYVMYKNTNYSTRWFYAFITRMEYENDGMTRVYIETDPFQTWQFDLTFKPSFVEREHVNDDTIGLHTVPENLDVGEVVEIDVQEDTSYTYKNYIAIECSYDLFTHQQYEGICVYNGTVFGNRIYVIPINNLNSYKNVYLFIWGLLADNQSVENIQNIFYIPDALIKPAYLVERTMTISGETLTYNELLMNADIQTISHSYTKPYTNTSIKNNKCFVYPYNYLLVSNNSGNYNLYKYEDFSGSNVTFTGQLAMSIGVSGRLVPTNYKGMPTADDEALALAKYPVCAWSSDAFTNWLTQNAVNIATDVAFGIVGVGANTSATTYDKIKAAEAKGDTAMIGKAGTVGAAINIAKTIGDQIGNFRSAALLPNIQGGQPTGDINFLAHRNTFTFRFMRAKPEYLKVIDDYFSAYGYRINDTKVPNLTGRTNWNYVKTVNCNIIADIPQEDLQKIKTMFNNGVTLWHNPSTFLDYSQSNAIVT